MKTCPAFSAQRERWIMHEYMQSILQKLPGREWKRGGFFLFFLLSLEFPPSPPKGPLQRASGRKKVSKKPLSASQIALCSFFGRKWQSLRGRERGLFWGGALRKKRLVFFCPISRPYLSPLFLPVAAKVPLMPAREKKDTEVSPGEQQKRNQQCVPKGFLHKSICWFLDKDICPSSYTSSLFPAKQRHDEDPYFRAEEKGQGKINPLGYLPRDVKRRKYEEGQGIFALHWRVLTYFAGERSCCGDLEPLGFDEDYNVSPPPKKRVFFVGEWPPHPPANRIILYLWKLNYSDTSVSRRKILRWNSNKFLSATSGAPFPTHVLTAASQKKDFFSPQRSSGES